MKRTAAIRLAEEIGQEILEGTRGVGEPLREEEIAESRGCSRHTVRTALAQLAAEGLADSVPYHGVRVRSFSADDVRALQDLRTALESHAVALLHERHGSAWPTAIRARLLASAHELQHCCRAPDAGWADVEPAHVDLHAAIVEAAASPRIISSHRALGRESQLMLRGIRPHYDLDGLAQEHLAYLEEIRTRGPEAVREHHARSTAVILGRV